MSNKFKIIPIFVLSLPGESVRKEFIRQQLNGYPGHWEFQDAVIPGETTGVTWNSSLDPERSISILGRPMTRGEYGCSCSHLKIMQKILIEEYDAALIIEDDAIMSGDFFKVCQNALLSLKFDVLLLGYSKVKSSGLWLRNLIEPTLTISTTFGRDLRVAYRERRSGTVGYLITSGGARKIIDFQKNVVTVADDWPFFKKMGLQIAHVFPVLVLEDTFTTASSIASDRKKIERVWNESLLKFLAIGKVVRGCLWWLLLKRQHARLDKLYKK